MSDLKIESGKPIDLNGVWKRTYFALAAFSAVSAVIFPLLGNAAKETLAMPIETLTQKFSEQCRQIGQVSDPSLLNLKSEVVRIMYENRDDPQECARLAAEKTHADARQVQLVNKVSMAGFGCLAVGTFCLGLYNRRREHEPGVGPS